MRFIVKANFHVQWINNISEEALFGITANFNKHIVTP